MLFTRIAQCARDAIMALVGGKNDPPSSRASSAVATENGSVSPISAPTVMSPASNSDDVAQPSADDWDLIDPSTMTTVFKSNVRRGRGRGAFGGAAPSLPSVAQRISYGSSDYNNIDLAATAERVSFVPSTRCGEAQSVSNGSADEGDNAEVAAPVVSGDTFGGAAVPAGSGRQSFGPTRGRGTWRGGNRTCAITTTAFGAGGGFGGGRGRAAKGGRAVTGDNAVGGDFFNCGFGQIRRDCDSQRRRSGCYNCSEEGHISRNCPVPRSFNCYNCEREGHVSKNCPNRKCFNCQQSGHISRNCTEERKPFNCFTCQKPGHISRNCPDRPLREAKDDRYVPPIRRIHEIFDEHWSVAEDYNTCADNDKEVTVVGDGENAIQKIETWADAKFEGTLLENISRSQYPKPRPIQQHTIPAIMGGRDVKGQAETGSGMSAAFLLPVIDWILKKKRAGAPKGHRQTLLFSATFPDDVEQISNAILRQGYVTISRKDRKMVATASRVTQRILEVHPDHKKGRLVELLEEELEEARKNSPEGDIRRTLVFVRTKRDADVVTALLLGFGFNAASINADRRQRDREETLRMFRENRVRVIVATDVMARGIDIHGLEHVINMDLPDDYATFVHRVGRTGRIREGLATSFFDRSDADQMLAINLIEELKSSGQEPPEFLTSVASGQAAVTALRADDDDDDFWFGGGTVEGGARQVTSEVHHIHPSSRW